MRYAPLLPPAAIDHGVPQFLQQLVDTLRLEHTSPSHPVAPENMQSTTEIGRVAGVHGAELLRRGYSRRPGRPRVRRCAKPAKRAPRSWRALRPTAGWGPGRRGRRRRVRCRSSRFHVKPWHGFRHGKRSGPITPARIYSRDSPRAHR